jgi:hypothetical protein
MRCQTGKRRDKKTGKCMTRKKPAKESPTYYTAPIEPNPITKQFRKSADAELRQKIRGLLTSLALPIDIPQIAKVHNTLMKILYNYADSVLNSYDNTITSTNTWALTTAQYQSLFADLSKQSGAFGYIIKLTKTVLKEFKSLVNDGISFVLVLQYPSITFLDENRFRYNDSIVVFEGLGKRYRMYNHLKVT